VSETPGRLHLRRFADRHGFDTELLAGHDRYAIVNAGASFDGHVDVIRLTEHGRFGNIFYQVLHAVLLARQIGATTVALFPFAGGPAVGRHVIDGLTFEVGLPPAAGMPALVGHFFNSYVFESALAGVPTDLLLGVVDRVMRPLFGHLGDAAPPGDADTVVLNMRGGDVFADPVASNWYVQPPASYYIRAALFAREAHGVTRVILVSEDDRNPAMGLTAAALEQAGLQVRRQSASFAEDAGLMINAAHLVSPFGTLCEALGMVSTRLRSYTAFRQFESHRHLHMRRPSVPLVVLRAHGVTVIRILDRSLNYTSPLTWTRDDHQMEMLRRFPIDRLHLDIPDDDNDDACFATFPVPGVQPMPREAFGMRLRMIAAESEIINAHREAERAQRAQQAAQAEATKAQAETMNALSNIAAAKQENAELHTRLDVALAGAAALRASTSWRMTAPLRRVTTALRSAGPAGRPSRR
jgi:hypothetical protein